MIIQPTADQQEVNWLPENWLRNSTNCGYSAVDVGQQSTHSAPQSCCCSCYIQECDFVRVGVRWTSLTQGASSCLPLSPPLTPSSSSRSLSTSPEPHFWQRARPLQVSMHLLLDQSLILKADWDCKLGREIHGEVHLLHYWLKIQYQNIGGGNEASHPAGSKKGGVINESLRQSRSALSHSQHSRISHRCWRCSVFLCSLCSKNWTNSALLKVHSLKQQCALSDSKWAPLWIHPPAFTAHHLHRISLGARVGVCVTE